MLEHHAADADQSTPLAGLSRSTTLVDEPDDVSVQDLQAKTALDLIVEARDKLSRSNTALSSDEEQIFDQLAGHVHLLSAQCAVTSQSSRTEAENTFFSAIKGMYSILDPLLHTLRNPSGTEVDTVLAFRRFKEALPKVSNDDESVLGTSSFDVASLYQSSLLAEPPPPSTDSCYMHAAISQLSLWRPAEQSCDLSEFATWAFNASMYRPEDFRARYGTVQRAHLFRSKKAPFHHEYVLVLLRNKAGSESWVRFERAARRKFRAAMPQFDSAGPLFGGVKLRETVSFASEMKALVHESDELGEVVMSSEIQPMSLDDLCQHVAGLSLTKPLYQLFSANCRWLARRALLTIAQWGTGNKFNELEKPSSLHRHVMRWKGRPISLPELSARLKKEKFGGRDIDGLGGIQLQAYSLAQLTGKHSMPADFDFPVAQDAYHRSLTYLEAIVSGIARDEGVRYPRVLDGPLEGSLDAALTYDFQMLVDAVPPSAFRATLPQYLDPYASFLFQYGQERETRTAARLSVEITREGLRADPSLSKEPLGRRLIEYGYYIAESSDEDALEQSFVIANEAVDIWRALYEEDPARYRMQYTNVLDGRADDLTSYNNDVDTEETYNIRREVLRLTRESYASDTDTAYQARDLLARLSTCGDCAKNLGHFQDALMLSFEAVALARENLLKSNGAVSDNPGGGNADKDWRSDVFTQSATNAKVQEAAGHLRSARASARELLVHIEDGQLNYPGTNSRIVAKRIHIAQDLFEMAELLARSDDLVLDLPSALRTVEHTERMRREIATTDYVRTSEHLRPSMLSHLEKTIALHARILHRLSRDREACILQAEVVESLRNVEGTPYSKRERRLSIGDALQDLELYLRGIEAAEENEETKAALSTLTAARQEVKPEGDSLQAEDSDDLVDQIRTLHM